MENFFPYICGSSTVLSLLIIYYLEIIKNFGIYTFIYGYCIHYLIQIVLSVILLYAKSPSGCYSFPGFNLLFKNLNELKFLINYSLAFLCELLSGELVPLILLYGFNPSLNIGIWSIIIQFINIMFYFGYAVSAYSRSVCNPLLALKNYEQLKDHLLITSVYLFITLSLSNLFVFIFSHYISGLFFSDENSAVLLSQCLQLLSMFFIIEGFIVYLNSALRMIGFDSFCFYVAFVIYILLFPPNLLYITMKYNTGAFIAIGVLYGFNSILCLLFLLRLLKGFKQNVYETFKKIENENLSKSLSLDKPKNSLKKQLDVIIE